MAPVTTTEDPPEPVSARPNRFWSLRVVFMNGKPAPEVLWISLDGKREITIGRDPSAVSFVLTDPKVSAVHAQIRRANDTWQIKDHQSRGGTFVNRVLARDWTPLHDQSVVSFGGGVLAIVGADGTVSMGQPLGGLVGQAFAMRLLFQELHLAASEDGTIILGGPTGVGKSCCAKAIHDQSARKEHPFREFSCADLNENLIESELFGHKAGAYTGASGNRLGRFVSAGEGTLFLDEIAELPLHLQTKLLGAFRREPSCPLEAIRRYRSMRALLLRPIAISKRRSRPSGFAKTSIIVSPVGPRSRFRRCRSARPIWCSWWPNTSVKNTGSLHFRS